MWPTEASRSEVGQSEKSMRSTGRSALSPTRTWPCTAQTDALCHFRTHGPQQAATIRSPRRRGRAELPIRHTKRDRREAGSPKSDQVFWIRLRCQTNNWQSRLSPTKSPGASPQGSIRVSNGISLYDEKERAAGWVHGSFTSIDIPTSWIRSGIISRSGTCTPSQPSGSAI
jgi:hypothetical protein